MTRRKTPEELDRSHCTATARGTGARCRRWSVSGYGVCVVHGAGAPVRRRRPAPDGRLRSDPRSAGLVHGVYARHLPDALAETVAAMAEAGDELFDLKIVAARLWALLLSADDVERAAFESTDLTEEPTPVLRAMNAVPSVTREIRRVIELEHRIRRRASAIDVAQLSSIIAVLLLRVHELALDETVARDEISPRTLDRLRSINRDVHASLTGEPAA